MGVEFDVPLNTI